MTSSPTPSDDVTLTSPNDVSFTPSNISQYSIDEDDTDLGPPDADDGTLRRSMADSDNDSMTPPVPEKKKKKRYRRFTKKYMRSRKSKCVDDDKIYKTRSVQVKDQALQISL